MPRPARVPTEAGIRDSKIETFGGALRNLLAEAEALLRDDAIAAGEQLDETWRDAHDSLRRTCEHLRAAERELGKRGRRVDAAVRQHPWETVAVVGIAAFLLGFLARRR